MGENSSNVGIEKLDKDNFQPWNFCMRNYLIGKDLWGFVIGEYKEPILSTRDVTVEELKAWKTWNEKDKRVMFLISQNVSNGMIGQECRYIRGGMGDITKTLSFEYKAKENSAQERVE